MHRSRLSPISKKRLARDFGGRLPHSSFREKPSAQTFAVPERAPVVVRPIEATPNYERPELVAVPREDRMILSDAELRKVKHDKIEAQNGACGICWKPLPTDPREVELDHIEPRGMDGAFRCDEIWNLRATHHNCNSDKGSRRMDTPERYELNRQTHAQLREEYFSRICPACHSPKRTETSLCWGCMGKLPEQMRINVYKLTGNSGMRAILDAKAYLKNLNVAHEAANSGDNRNKAAKERE